MSRPGVVRHLPLLALMVAGAAGVARAQPAEITPPTFDAGVAFAASQAAIGRQLSAAVFTDQAGRRVTLADLRGKPLVISPIYTSCFQVCPTTTAYLKIVTDIAADALGPASFNVLSVGFDTAHDTPTRMREYAGERGIDEPHWIFASTDAATAARLLGEIGFTYAPTAGGFDHMVQATVVDGEGRVYRQVYGQQFETPLLVDALKRILLRQPLQRQALPSLAERVRLFCTVFDPKSGRYRFDYSIVLAVAIGVLCFTAVGVFIWRSWRQLAARQGAA